MIYQDKLIQVCEAGFNESISPRTALARVYALLHMEIVGEQHQEELAKVKDLTKEQPTPNDDGDKPVSIKKK